MDNEVTRVLVLHEYSFIDHVKRHLIPKIQGRVEILPCWTNADAKQWIRELTRGKRVDVAIIHLRFAGWEEEVDSVVELTEQIREKYPFCRIGIESGLVDHGGVVASK